MKRVIALLLASAMAMGLGACGASDGMTSSSASSDSSPAAPSDASSSNAASPSNEKLAQIIKITITEMSGTGESSSSAAETSSGAALSQAAADAARTDGSLAIDPLPPAEEIAARMEAMRNGTGDYADCPIAEIETNVGVIKIRLFPDVAPKAVENFVTHAKEGYYDGQTFHRVINDFMIQGGDPTGTGMGGESIWGAPFEDEFSDYAYNFRGALSMANAGANTNGSQFFIVQAKTASGLEGNEQQYLLSAYMNRIVEAGQKQIDAMVASGASDDEIQARITELNGQIQEIADAGVPDDFAASMQPVLDTYKELGGTPHLDRVHTVFGFVFEGMDVVDQIAADYATE